MDDELSCWTSNFVNCFKTSYTVDTKKTLALDFGQKISNITPKIDIKYDCNHFEYPLIIKKPHTYAKIDIIIETRPVTLAVNHDCLTDITIISSNILFNPIIFTKLNLNSLEFNKIPMKISIEHDPSIYFEIGFPSEKNWSIFGEVLTSSKFGLNHIRLVKKPTLTPKISQRNGVLDILKEKITMEFSHNTLNHSDYYKYIPCREMIKEIPITVNIGLLKNYKLIKQIEELGFKINESDEACTPSIVLDNGSRILVISRCFNFENHKLSKKVDTIFIIENENFELTSDIRQLLESYPNVQVVFDATASSLPQFIIKLESCENQF